MDVIIIGEHLYNTLGQIRCFGEMGISPIVIWTTQSVYTPQHSRYVKAFFQAADPEDGVRLMVERYGRGEGRYVVSTDSDRVMSLLDRRFDELTPHFLFFNAGGQGRLSPYLKKQEQCILAENVGLRVPRTWKIFCGEIPADIRYPVFTKAIDSFDYHWKSVARIIRSEEELKAFFAASDVREILLQEYIGKKNELAFEGVSFRGGKDLYLPVQGEYLRLPDDGFGTYKRNEAYRAGDEMKERIRKMMETVGYSGIFEMEFLEGKDGGLYYLETNFRQTQYNHALADMGVNLSRVWYRSCLSDRLETGEERIVRSPSLVLNEVKDFKAYVSTGKMTLRAWIRDLYRADSHYFLDRRDWPFVLRYFLRSICLNIKGICKKALGFFRIGRS